ncbi:hypothetical protein GCM10009602_70320 [Nocardiopsis tropica]
MADSHHDRAGIDDPLLVKDLSQIKSNDAGHIELGVVFAGQSPNVRGYGQIGLTWAVSDDRRWSELRSG